MRSDARSRKVVLVSHCLLNQNAKVEGLARYPGVFEPLAEVLCSGEAGLLQMPCPEVAEFGLQRPHGTDTREQYDTPEYWEACRRLAAEVAGLAATYRQAGYAVACVLGVEGSPSCSVERVPVIGPGGQRVLQAGQGVFTEALVRELERAGVEVPFIGIPETEEAGSLREALAEVAEAIARASV